MAKWVSLIVKLGALVFIIFVPTKFAIYLPVSRIFVDELTVNVARIRVA